MKSTKEVPIKDKHLLLAVDQTENSKRAVLYVADFLGGLPGFRVTLLSIIAEPEEDFFNNKEEQVSWTRKKTEETNDMLEDYRQMLIQAGFEPDRVRIRACLNEVKSLSEAILDMRCEPPCNTVVVGRHHKTKTEEFLYGSTSSKLIHEARNCAVWVVE